VSVFWIALKAVAILSGIVEVVAVIRRPTSRVLRRFASVGLGFAVVALAAYMIQRALWLGFGTESPDFGSMVFVIATYFIASAVALVAGALRQHIEQRRSG
jgi:hypothetical protein